jgi:hypothetical protein
MSLTPQDREQAAMVVGKSGWSWAGELVRLIERGDEQWFDPEMVKDFIDQMETRLEQFVADCAASDNRPTVIDFAIWLIHSKGLSDGQAMMQDILDEEVIDAHGIKPS